MPRGPGPDDNINESGQVQAQWDLGETVARLNRGLGGTHRAGRLMFSTSFAGGLGELHQKLPIGTGAKVALDTTISEYGAQSVKLTHGNVVGNKSSCSRFIPGGFGSRLGFECGIWNLNSTMRWYMTVANFIGGTVVDTYEWRLTTTSSQTELAYRSGAAAWTVWQTLNIPLFGPSFNNLKVVVDGATRNYARLFINGAEQLLNGAPLVAPPFTGVAVQNMPAFFQLYLTLEARVAANLSINWGSMVNTIDEP